MIRVLLFQCHTLFGLFIFQNAFAQELTNDIDRMWASALNERDSGNIRRALAILDEVITLDPERGDLYNSRGKTYFDMAVSGSYPAESDSLLNLVIRDCTTGLGCRPLKKEVHSELLANRGAAYGVKQQYSLALRDFNASIKKNPDNKNGYYNRSICYYNLGQYNKSISDYTHYLRLDPNNHIILYERGMLQRVLNKNKKAIKDLNRAIELSPDFGLAYLERARAYAQAGDKTAARRDYEAARVLGINWTEFDVKCME